MEDVPSSPPRAPKSQLAVEQPSARGLWNPPRKDTPRPKTKQKLQQDGRGGPIMINQTLYWPSGWRTNWRTIILPEKFSHCYEGSRLHIRLCSLGVWQRDWESPGNLTLKVSRAWLQDFHRTGGQRLQSLGTQTKPCIHPLWLAIIIIFSFFLWLLIVKTLLIVNIYSYYDNVTITYLWLYHDWSIEKL